MVKRGRGRPPVDKDDPSVQVGVMLPSKKFDELDARARREGVSLPEVIRRVLYATDTSQEKKYKK